MITVWNYNKSRIHSFEGVKNIEMYLDDVNLIFKGNIKRANGGMKVADQDCDYIMFTQDQQLLKSISSSDWTFEINMALSQLAFSNSIENRPKTGQKPSKPKA